MTMQVQVPSIPESAPFSEAQRAWLNGFIAGLMNVEPGEAEGASAVSEEAEAKTWRDVDEEEAEYDWHDPALSMEERMELVKDRPLELRLMGAMAQLDCGACGYLCRSYSKAIADGEERDLGRCVPGGKETARMLKQITKEQPPGDGPVTPATVNGQSVEAEPAGEHDRDHPFPAPVLSVERLTTEKSDKDTRFVSVAIAGSGLNYEVGDSLGVYPKNCYEQMNALIRLLGVGGGEPVTLGSGRRLTLREVLIGQCDIATSTDELYELLAECAGSGKERDALKGLVEGRAAEGLVEEPRVIDVLARFGSARPEPAALVGALEALKPRLYSISSSPRVYPDEVHLTVGVVRYQQGGQWRKGVASTFLADRVRSHEPVDVFVQKSHGFGLTGDDARPILMIGPGTGIAPFRAFLQHRQASGAKGKNWLFFGDRHAKSDFLYRDELEQYRRTGLLDQLTTAFSRDQDRKVYVQDRLRESGRQVWDWLESGACVYVCGDASRMARDVDAALHEVVRDQGGLSEDNAKGYIQRMRESQRYQRDVY